MRMKESFCTHPTHEYIKNFYQKSIIHIKFYSIMRTLFPPEQKHIASEQYINSLFPIYDSLYREFLLCMINYLEYIALTEELENLIINLENQLTETPY